MLTFPPDWTFLFQIFLFLVLWLFLKRLLFDPVLSVLESRERRSEGTLEEAHRTREEAQEMAEKYRQSISATRASALQQVEGMYREEEERSRALLEAAREQAAAIVAESRQRIRHETQEAGRALEARVPEFSQAIAEKLMGRPLTDS
jgi:F-type H+-transporting ATPase subunit b